MKNVFKPSAVALIIAGVISGSAMAADANASLVDSIASALSDRFVTKSEGEAANHSNAEDLKKVKAAIKETAEKTQEALNLVGESFTEVNDKVDANKKALDAHKSDFAGLVKNIAEDLAPQVSENTSDVDELYTEVESINKQVDQNEADIKAIGDGLTTVSNKQAEHETKLADLDDDISELQGVTLDNKSNIEANKAAIDTKADKKDLDAHKSDFAGLVKNIAENLAPQVSENTNDVDELYTEVESINKQVDQNEADIKAIGDGLTTVSNKQAEHEAKLADLDDDISELQGVTLENRENIEKHNERIAALELGSPAENSPTIKDALEKKADKSDFDILAEEVQENSDNIEGLSGEVTAHRTAIENNAKNLTALAKSHNELYEDHHALAESHDELGTMVENNKQDADKRFKATHDSLQEISNQIGNTKSELSNNISAVGKDLGATAAVTKANKADVSTNKADIKANRMGIQRNLAGIQANSATAATNHNDIAVLQTQVAQHNTRISQNSARIDTLDHKVNRLQKDVKRGLAAQAALTGLFQPYKVGRANFTAAVGGYKSETAVAVGTGYRFNENVAVKSGVAFSTNGGGASYNAGVNFEW